MLRFLAGASASLSGGAAAGIIIAVVFVIVVVVILLLARGRRTHIQPLSGEHRVIGPSGFPVSLADSPFWLREEDLVVRAFACLLEYYCKSRRDHVQ